jgi:hypothetical protein
MAEAVDQLERETLTRRQLLRSTWALLAVGAVAVLFAGWNVYRDMTRDRSARGRRRKWKWGGLALLWFGLAYWSEHRDEDQRSSSSE